MQSQNISELASIIPAGDPRLRDVAAVHVRTPTRTVLAVASDLNRREWFLVRSIVGLNRSPVCVVMRSDLGDARL